MNTGGWVCYLMFADIVPNLLACVLYYNNKIVVYKRPDSCSDAFFMHLLDSSIYPNLLEQISLTSDEIQSSISYYSLSFPQERNPEVEWQMKLPMFVNAFYDYIICSNRIPSQLEFYNYYISINQQYFNSINRPDLTSGIKARVYRTYPSLIRDIHFNKYVQENLNLNEYSVVYNTELDIQEGIDLLIVKKNTYYGICLFTSTTRGYNGRVAKQTRHTYFDNVIFIELPVNFKGSVQSGQFFLYGKTEFDELINKINAL